MAAGRVEGAGRAEGAARAAMALLLQGPSAERRLAGLAVAASLLRARREAPQLGDDGLLGEIHAALAPSRFLERLLAGGLRARDGGAATEKGLQGLAAAVAAALCSEPSLAREMADSLIPALLHILREACDEISGAVGGGPASFPPADRAEPASEQSVRLVLDVLDALLGIARALCPGASAAQCASLAGPVLRALPIAHRARIWPGVLSAVRVLYCLSCSGSWGVSSPVLTPGEAVAGLTALGACLAGAGAGRVDPGQGDVALQVQLETVRLLGSPFSSLVTRCLLDRAWGRVQRKEWEGRLCGGLAAFLSNRVDGALRLAALRAVGAVVELQGMGWVLAGPGKTFGDGGVPLYPVLVSVVKVETALLLSELLNPRPEPRGGSEVDAESLIRDLQTCFSLAESCIQALCELGERLDGSNSGDDSPAHLGSVEPHTLLLSLHELVGTVIDYLLSDASEGDVRGRASVTPGALRLTACYLSQNPAAFPAEGRQLLQRYCGAEAPTSPVPFFLPLVFQVLQEPEWQDSLHGGSFLGGLAQHVREVATLPFEGLANVGMLLEVLGGLFSPPAEERLRSDSDLGRAFMALVEAALGSPAYSETFHDPEESLRSLSIFVELLALWLGEDCDTEATPALAALTAKGVFLAVSLVDGSPSLPGGALEEVLGRIDFGLDVIIAAGRRDTLFRSRMEAASPPRGSTVLRQEDPADPGAFGRGFDQRCEWAASSLGRARNEFLKDLQL